MLFSETVNREIIMNSKDLSPIVRKILSQRGITAEEDIEEYISLRPKRTYDPFLMKGMDAACDMIEEYAGQGRKICIYGDYDADGVTSVSLMLTVLKQFASNVDYYIPSRFKEGYGLNRGAIDIMKSRGTELVITVDNGCVALDEVAYIIEKGMAVIVTDHHNVGEEIPDCIMLNPKQPGDEYPFNFLCGCGIAFKLAQALNRRGLISKKLLNSLLDITGVATVGDIVPLTDENRTLVKYGLDRLKRNERPGLQELCRKIKLDPHTIGSYNIAFGIVPHINSCGRMASADLGVRLLTGSQPEELEKLADDMARLNAERKAEQDRIYKTAVKELEAGEDIPLFIVYYAGGAHEGVTGIVAGKIKEKFCRPVIIFTDIQDGGVKGTGRSIPGVDLHGLLKKYSDLYSRFGGHAGACGLSMKRKDLDYLRERLNEDMVQIVREDPEIISGTITPDICISGDEVRLELARDIQLMEPFGEGNQRPVFRIDSVEVKNLRRLGSEGQYTKLRCMSAGGNAFDVMSFDSDMKNLSLIGPGDMVSLTGEIDENVWNGRHSVQVILRAVSLQD